MESVFVKKYLDCIEDRIIRSLWIIAMYELHNVYDNFPQNIDEGFLYPSRIMPISSVLQESLEHVRMLRDELKIPPLTPYNTRKDPHECDRVEFWNNITKISKLEDTTPERFILEAILDKLHSKGIDCPITLSGLNGIRHTNHTLSLQEDDLY